METSLNYLRNANKAGYVRFCVETAPVKYAYPPRLFKQKRFTWFEIYHTNNPNECKWVYEMRNAYL